MSLLGPGKGAAGAVLPPPLPRVRAGPLGACPYPTGSDVMLLRRKTRPAGQVRSDAALPEVRGRGAGAAAPLRDPYGNDLGASRVGGGSRTKGVVKVISPRCWSRQTGGCDRAALALQNLELSASPGPHRGSLRGGCGSRAPLQREHRV